jgi:hypothetical protein
MMIATGAYYEDQPIKPIGGLGATDAEKALEQLLASAQAIDTVTPWATQTGEIDYEQLQPTHSYLVFPLSAALLAEAERIAGVKPSSVAIFGGPQLTLSEIEAAFAGTPYRLATSMVVYRQSDQRAVPEALSLRYAVLREAADPYGGPDPVSVVAERLAGRLVATTELPLTGHERLHPTLPVVEALAVQEALPGEAAPAVLNAGGEVTPTGWLVLGAVAVTVGAVGYYAYRSMTARRRLRAAGQRFQPSQED